MPYLEISFNDIKFDRKVYDFCNNPKFLCPNYGMSWSCPPASPFMEKEISKYNKFYLIYVKFNILKYIKKVKEIHPKRSEAIIKSSLYRKNIINEMTIKEINNFIEETNISYEHCLILWPERCKICSKENISCTYSQNKPCRLPEKMTYSMTGAGVNTDLTVKKLNFNLEWPPVHYSYRFGLICFK